MVQDLPRKQNFTVQICTPAPDDRVIGSIPLIITYYITQCSYLLNFLI